MAGVQKTIPPSTSPSPTSEEALRRAEAMRVMLAQPSLEGYRHCTLDNFDPKPDAEALAQARYFVRATDGWFRAGRPAAAGAPQLYLTSARKDELIAPGSGKTHLAVGILRALAEMGHARVYKHERTGEEWPNLVFIQTDALIREVRSGYARDAARGPDEVAGRYIGADVLVLDDVGTEPDKEDATARMFSIIEKRMLRPTIYTSNYTTKQLSGRVVEWAKLVSRMRSGLRGCVLKGPDRRPAAADPWEVWVNPNQETAK